MLGIFYKIKREISLGMGFSNSLII